MKSRHRPYHDECAEASPIATLFSLRAYSGGTIRFLSRMLVAGAASLALFGSASAEQPVPAGAATPGAGAGKPTAVRIVCLAEKVESFFKNNKVDLAGLLFRRIQAGIDDWNGKPNDLIAYLNSQYPPVGGWHYLPIGTGFVVDAERLHVVTNKHVALACIKNEAEKMQIGIIEGNGNEIDPILADVLEKRVFHNERGETIEESVKVDVLCRDRNRPCSADPEKKLLENVEFFAPDLTVLRLRRKAQTAPIPLAPNMTVDAKMDLQVAGFPQIAMQLSQGNGSPRRQAVTMITTPARYSNSFTRDNVRPGLKKADVVSADFMMLAAQVLPGNSGGPVLANDQVVGVITAALVLSKNGGPSNIIGVDADLIAQKKEIATPAGYALAIKASEVVNLLEWLNIKPAGQVALASLPLPKPELAIENPVKPQPAWWMQRQNQVFIGLAVCLLVAAIAFYSVHANRENGRPIPAPGIETHGLGNEASSETSTQPTATPAARQLRGSHGPLNGQTFSLPTPNGGVALTAGRNPQTCQIVFPNETVVVSRLHCSFVWNPSNQTLTVEDIGSSEGTFVNGKRLAKNEKSILKEGDTIDLGGMTANRFSVHNV